MPHSLFVSDLHLCPSRPALAGIFFEFLRGAALRADALYILGDLFEYWAGDDDDTDFNRAVVDALKDRKSTRLNSSHSQQSRMPSSA